MGFANQMPAAFLSSRRSALRWLTGHLLNFQPPLIGSGWFPLLR